MGSIAAFAFGTAEKGTKFGSTGDSDDAAAARTAASAAGGAASKKLESDMEGGEVGGAWESGAREVEAGFAPIVSEMGAGPPSAARAGAKELAPIFFSPPPAAGTDGDDATGCAGAGDGEGEDRVGGVEP